MLDSSKVEEANRLAVRLREYDGPTALTFKLVEAHAEGKSREELKQIIQSNEKSCGVTTLDDVTSVTGTTLSCETLGGCTLDCGEDMRNEISDNTSEFADEMITDCGSVVGAGIAAAWKTAGVSAILGTVGAVACGINSYRELNKKNGWAIRDHGICVDRCIEECNKIDKTE